VYAIILIPAELGVADWHRSDANPDPFPNFHIDA
jgi:hypothetical protein